MISKLALLRIVVALIAAFFFCIGNTAIAAERTFDVSIARRHVANGMSTIRVTQGDQVELRWHTDEAASIHLHGYDITTELAPPAPVPMRFTADIAGRFPISAHRFGGEQGRNAQRHVQHETPLLYLEVLPQ